MPRPALLLALTFLAAPALSAWGVLGHRMAATGALQDLPAALAPWFAGQEATLPDHANDPDRWKFHDPLEGPRHYLNCEPYGGAAQVPRSEPAAQARLGAELFRHAGQVPWTILDRVQVLARAFSAGDPAQVAYEASILSHYVADLCVPLHTTLNHDGDLTGQHGIHARWEDGLLKRIVDREGWLPDVRPAVLGPDPDSEPWAWLQGSFSLVPGVLADDLTAERAAGAGGGTGLGHLYWQAFLPLQEPHVKEQLTLAAQRTAEMIALAWQKAGRPEVHADPPVHPSR